MERDSRALTFLLYLVIASITIAIVVDITNKQKNNSMEIISEKIVSINRTSGTNLFSKDQIIIIVTENSSFTLPERELLRLTDYSLKEDMIVDFLCYTTWIRKVKKIIAIY